MASSLSVWDLERQNSGSSGGSWRFATENLVLSTRGNRRSTMDNSIQEDDVRRGGRPALRARLTASRFATARRPALGGLHPFGHPCGCTMGVP